MTRIVLVEDSPADAELTELALHETGERFSLEVISDGYAAIDRLSRDPAPHLVLLDLNLPGMSGLQVLKAAATPIRTRQIPVVVLTSSARAQERTEGLTLGAAEWASKPADYRAYFELLADLLRRYRPPA